MRLLVPVLAAVLLGVVVLCVVAVPSWLVPDDGLGLVDQLRAENEVRTTMLQALGGLLALGGVALGAVMTLRQVRANREGTTIGLFTNAISQLASDDLSVRHGGVYALELLADLDPGYRGHAHALLTAFVRQRAPWPPVRQEDELAAERARYHGGLADDVGAAFGVLSRRSVITPGDWSELERVDLRGAELPSLDIPDACFAHSNLEGADLHGAQLAGATISDVVLRQTNLADADLQGADLTGTDLTGANLRGADLRGADLTGATLTDAELDGAVSDGATRWPPGSPGH